MLKQPALFPGERGAFSCAKMRERIAPRSVLPLRAVNSQRYQTDCSRLDSRSAQTFGEESLRGVAYARPAWEIPPWH